jgi:hypothetical protein
MIGESSHPLPDAPMEPMAYGHHGQEARPSQSAGPYYHSPGVAVDGPGHSQPLAPSASSGGVMTAISRHKMLSICVAVVIIVGLAVVLTIALRKDEVVVTIQSANTKQV